MTNNNNLLIKDILVKSQKASLELASLSGEIRNDALKKMALAIETSKEKLLAANKKDLDNANALFESGKISAAIVNRLKLTDSKIRDIVYGINEVAKLSDPIGITLKGKELDKKLELFQVTAPIGLLAVIFESRPDALPQITSLAIKTGNAVLLKGGSEAEHSLKVLFECIRGALADTDIPVDAVNLLSTREDVANLLGAEGIVDLIIPRGSNSLVRHIQDNTRIPVLGHADGICHLYVHEDADIEMAKELTLDSKTQYPSACNAIETLLVHKSLLSTFLPSLVNMLIDKNVELRLDSTAYDYLSETSDVSPKLAKAKESDWESEYCDLILSIKIVEDLDSAIEHINKYGSGHTDCIVTENKNTFEKFFNSIDSAGVYWNASTRFADGFRYGFGAEVGIATGKLHPRGPVGLEGLVTYKYRLEGQGQIVAQYSGENAKQFTHKDI